MEKRWGKNVTHENVLKVIGRLECLIFWLFLSHVIKSYSYYSPEYRWLEIKKYRMTIILRCTCHWCLDEVGIFLDFPQKRKKLWIVTYKNVKCVTNLVQTSNRKFFLKLKLYYFFWIYLRTLQSPIKHQQNWNGIRECFCM